MCKDDKFEVISFDLDVPNPYIIPSQDDLKLSEIERSDKKNKEIDYICEQTIKILPLKVLSVFDEVYGGNSKDVELCSLNDVNSYNPLLKTAIREFLISVNPDYRNSSEKMNIPLAKYVEEQKYKFQRQSFIQKNRWKTKALASLDEKSSFTYNVYLEEYKIHNNKTYMEFKQQKKKEIAEWMVADEMVNFPFFSSFHTKKSKKSALNYDIGKFALDYLILFLNKIVYRQPDYLTTNYFFSKSTRSKAKVELITNNNDVIIRSEESMYGLPGEQMSLIDYLSIEGMYDEQRTLLDKLTTQFDKFKDSAIIKQAIKDTLMYMSAFNKNDSEVFSYILSQISEQFYLYKDIHIIEKDALEVLGKNPDQPRNRIWLRNICKKLRLKQIPVVQEDGDEISITHPTLFQNIGFKKIRKGKSRRSYNVIVMTASEVLHNLIIKEDTVNVYNEDFRNIKKSEYPDATDLIFRLQLLRLSLYKLGRIKTRISRNFFAKILNVNTLSAVEQVKEISLRLNVYKERKVFISDFKYVDKTSEFEMEFFPFLEEDLTILINSRKDYSKIAESHFGLLALE